MKKLLNVFKTNKYVPFVFVIVYCLTFFIRFLPFSYTLTNKQISFINGYQLFIFMQDSQTMIHFYSVCSLLSLIFSGLTVLDGISCFLVRDENVKKFTFSFGQILSIISFGCDLASIIFLSKCSEMSLNIEAGSIVHVILLGLAMIYVNFVNIYQAVQLKKEKKK